MINDFNIAWGENANNLREYFETHPQSEYDSYKIILKIAIDCIVNQNVGFTHFDTNNITEVDDGDYQGTLIFIVPEETYQPNASEYIVTYVFYGSCSGCDTLLSISDYEDGIPTKEQVNDYMQLALHMLQHAKYIYKDEEDEIN